MKKILLFGFILALIISTSGCSPKDAGKANSKATTVTGAEEEKPQILLHGLDFIDENIGWVISDENVSNQKGSKLLWTEDGGTQWKDMGINNMKINEVRFINKTTGWAIVQDGVKDTSDNTPSTIQILNTRDGGATWTVQWHTSLVAASGFELWFGNNEHGYAIIGKTMLSTKDGGKHWSSVSFNIKGFIPEHMDFTSSNIGWITGQIEQVQDSKSSGQGSDNKIMVLSTINGGSDWQKQFEKSFPKEEGFIGIVHIDFVNASTGWFLTSNMATMMGELYYTSNAGKSWEKINEIKSARPTPSELFFITDKIGWVPLDVGAGPIEGGLLTTEDGGRNFKIINSSNKITSAKEVDFTSQQRGWAIATNLGDGDYLIKTTDGGNTWTQ